MSEKVNGAAMNLGEIGVIRDILMGHQIAEFEKKFNLLEETMRQLDKAAQERQQALEEQINARFDRFEQTLTGHVDHINRQMRDLSKTDKHSLSDLLQELSARLKE